MGCYQYINGDKIELESIYTPQVLILVKHATLEQRDNHATCFGIYLINPSL